MDIDEDAAKLVYDTYRKIHSLKGLLHDPTHIELKELIESGDTLSKAIDPLLDERPISDILMDLSETIQYLTGLIEFSIRNEKSGLSGQKEITAYLRDILEDLKAFQVKIQKQVS
ncbi:MAG: hypothetical protein GC180_07295 [Bacteroidetes bacterium]|nr:hypothetical protein [Bacteroidota bacterium]